MLGDIMVKNKIYRIGRKLGLEKNEIDIVINTTCKKTNNEFISDIYKVGALYGTISPNNY
jgi:hypothetical protein